MTHNSTIPRVLIIKLSSLGDLFHALPAVSRIKAAWNADIDWLTQPEYTDLVRCFDDVNRVYSFPRRNFARDIIAGSRELRKNAYDYILDMQGLFKSALAGRIAVGRRRIGPSFHREFSRLLYNEIAGAQNRNRHAVDEILDTVRHLGINPGPVEFNVSFPSTPEKTSRPRVAMITRSRWATKNWPAERFIETGNALIHGLQATIYLIGSGDDREFCGVIQSGLGGNCRNLCGCTSLVELGGVIAQMDLVISVDSGPMHMAAAAGVPVVAVFGSTDPIRTGPYTSKSRVITHDDMPCRPCRSRTCLRPEKDIACMNTLPAARVIDSALEILSNPERHV